MPSHNCAALRRSLDQEVHVWRWRGPRGDPRLKELIAAYLGRPAEQLPWTVRQHGKPALSGSNFEFNWSHCDGDLLLAVTEGAEVGVDLEMPRPLRRRQALLARAFTASERVALCKAADADVLLAWAHKEALVKAIGRGIAFGLNRIELDLTDLAKPRLLALRGAAAPVSVSVWQIEALPQHDDALAAVAWTGAPRLVRQFLLDVATGRPASASSMERVSD